MTSASLAMADWFSQLESGVDAAQDAFGESFTLDTSLTVFKGIVELDTSPDPDDYGEYNSQVDAVILCTKTQFTTAGVTAEVDDTITYDSNDYRLLRINEDNSSFEFNLRRIDD